MAAKTIANPTVVLGLRDQLSRGLTRALSSAKKFSHEVVGAMEGVGGTIAGLLGSAGIAELVKSTSEAIDVSAKLADSLGIATESLAGLQLAANLAGASNEDLTSGLQKMLKNISEATSGVGGTADALKELGLDALELKRTSPDEAFGLIADALNRLPSQYDKAETAQAIFGKGGQALIPLLSAGSAGLRESVEEAKRLGISFDRLDAAKVEEANDAITRMKSAIQGAANSLAIELAPSIKKASDTVTQLAASNSSGLSSLLKWVGGVGAGVLVVPRFTGLVGSLSKALGASSGYVGTLVVLLADLAAAYGRSKITGESFAESIYQTNKGLLTAVGLIPSYVAAIENARAATSDASANVAAAEGALAALDANAPLEQRVKLEQQLAAALDTRAKATDNLNATVKAEQGKSQGANQRFNDLLGIHNPTQQGQQQVRKGLDVSAPASAVQANAARLTTVQASLKLHQDEIKRANDEAVAWEAVAKRDTEGRNARGAAARRYIKDLDAIQDAMNELKHAGGTDVENKLFDLGQKGINDESLKKIKEYLNSAEQTKRTLAEVGEVHNADPLEEKRQKLALLEKAYKSGAISAAKFYEEIRDAKKTFADELKAEAESVKDSVKTPGEHLREQTDKLKELLGHGDIDQKTFDRAVTKAKKDFTEALGPASLAEGTNIQAKSGESAALHHGVIIPPDPSLLEDPLAKIPDAIAQSADKYQPQIIEWLRQFFPFIQRIAGTPLGTMATEQVF